MIINSVLAGSGGGGGFGELLKTETLENVSVSSTSAIDIGKSVTVDNVDKYDLLIYEFQRTEFQQGYLMGCVSMVWLYGYNIEVSKTTAYGISNKLSIMGASGNTYDSIQTGKGLYVSGATIADGSATSIINGAYNSSQTGTISGDYIVNVYGINIVDLLP